MSKRKNDTEFVVEVTDIYGDIIEQDAYDDREQAKIEFDKLSIHENGIIGSLSQWDNEWKLLPVWGWSLINREVTELETKNLRHTELFGKLP